MDSFNIIFSSSGRRVALIRNFKRTLQSLRIKETEVTADLQKHAPDAKDTDLLQIFDITRPQSGQF